ncbi:MAG TPA: DUF1073 domain-containing protein [Acidobacteriaceae bacterium]|jgi:hypothetical protein
MPKKSTTAQARDSSGRFVSKTVAQAEDAYSNVPARMGYGTPNLVDGSEWINTRFSNDYQTLLALYRSNWIARRICDAQPQYALKAWPTITSDIPQDDRKKLDRTLARTKTKDQLLTTIQWARLFGGAGALLCIAGQEDMLDQPLDLDSIEIGSFKGIIPFDRWSGITNSTKICSDISKPLQFGKPESYQVHPPTGGAYFEVHASRILRFTGPMVPSPEYQAQSYWGISVLELAHETLKMVDSALWSIINLLFRAQILSEKNPELAQMLAGAGLNQQSLQMFQKRMQEKNHLISNQGLNIIGKDGEFFSSQYSFGGVADVLQQIQLFAAGAAETPVSILFGRTLSGLGQSNDADLQIFEDRIAQWQNSDLRPVLEQQLYPVVCMSEWGEVPDDLDLDFPSIRTLTDKDKRDLEKAASESIFGQFDRSLYGKKSALTAFKQLADALGLSTPITQDMIDAATDDAPEQGDVPLEGLNEEDEPVEAAEKN